jgi:hypothetical protein
LKPCRVKALGVAAAIVISCGLPSSPLTINTAAECGAPQRNSLSVACADSVFDMSMPANE